MTEIRSVIPQWRRESLRKALEEGPRNLAGDPAFESIAQLEKYFTPAEIVWLANRALYQEDYQRSYHKKRAEKKKEMRTANRLSLLKERLEQGGAPPMLDVVSVQRSRVRLEEAELEAIAKGALPLIPDPEEIEREVRLNEAFAKRRVL